jgi:N-acyl homoserine lactone hydrolase
MFRIFKRIAKIFLLLLLVSTVALYFLFFHRTPLPPAPIHARAFPTIAMIPGLAACWIETGKTFSGFPFGMTGGSLLVKHPAGDLLVDAGNSSHLGEEIAGYPLLLRMKLQSLGGQLGPETPIPEALRRIGENPANIRWAILSHVHFDHSGGLMDLPRIPLLLTREELQFANDPEAQSRGYVFPAHVQKFPRLDAPTLKFDSLPYETFDQSADLYKDGSVVVVPLRGHTPGSVGIFVNLSPARRLLYVGDAVDDERGFEERVGKSLLLKDSDNDPVLADQMVARLNALHHELPQLAIIPAHGRSAYKKFFVAGPLSCVSGR